MPAVRNPLSIFMFRNSSPLVVLTLCLGLRLITLNYPDLIDPTESRYAYVAQEMFLTGDWIVPKLPKADGIEPYLGKPPLHFWLTAIGFSVFKYASVGSAATKLPRTFCHMRFSPFTAPY